MKTAPSSWQLCSLADRNAFNLLLSFLRLSADGVSAENLLRELGAAYSGHTDSAEEPFRYVQSAQWQKGDLHESEDETAIAGKNYWKKQLDIE